MINLSKLEKAKFRLHCGFDLTHDEWFAVMSDLAKSYPDETGTGIRQVVATLAYNGPRKAA